MKKRIFDLIFAFCGILLSIPILIIVAILIKISMPNENILFIQKRIGRNGVIFRMVKFRTMQSTLNKNTITVKGDKRITSLGKILRRYKIDELPELFNVLIGDMSFVGPRPDVPGYADKLTGNNKKILLLRPGITGPATLKYSNEEELLSKKKDPVRYNNEVIYPDKIKINLDYYNNNSLLKDINIILKTIFRRNY